MQFLDEKLAQKTFWKGKGPPKGTLVPPKAARRVTGGPPGGPLGSPWGGEGGSLGISRPSVIPLGVPGGVAGVPQPPKGSSQGTLGDTQGGGVGPGGAQKSYKGSP